MNNNRRTFIRNASVAVTAAVAGSGASAATDTNTLEHKLGVLEDLNAIRALQQRYFALVQQRNDAELAALFVTQATQVHTARVLDARLDDASIEVAQDRQSASAQLRSRVQLATPMRGNGTLQQMARLQGQSEQQWSESGVYTAQYVKLDGKWKISSLSFHKA
jgi:recombinational DNA repair ATPase RecF